MAYLANLCARPPDPRKSDLGLCRPVRRAAGGLCLAVHGSASATSLPQKLLLVAVLVGPLFFSGMVFSTLLKGSRNISGAMAYNLMGAMLGGAPGI